MLTMNAAHSLQPSTTRPTLRRERTRPDNRVIQRALASQPTQATTTGTVGTTARTGYSSHPSDTRRMIAMSPTFAANFATMVQQVEPWSIYSCAEPNALAKLIASNPRLALRDVRIAMATRVSSSHELMQPCRNCSQWLEADGSYSFKIKESFLPRPPPPPRPVFNYDTDFPPLGS